uniref:Vacuolar protein sorting-associated protein 26 n=1 Tax=Dunaliella tertiolecta TaxID=3047 RepID=A0A7S3R0N7_DUNTE|mmetsp:Transcript_19413/g.54264  ORF Transcript_19413/g.54264 Transcript_19413/m.54264 type:complete len:652 (+) Transcript_19413:114-2069(+)
MKSILGYIQGSPFRIDTEFLDAEGKPYKNTTPVKGKKDALEDAPVYANRDTVKGLVKITPVTTKKLEHMGIKAQLLGRIDVASERGAKQEFMSMARGLAGSGEISSPITLPFEFPNVEMQYDSYKGQQVRCHYFLRVNIAGKGMTPDTKHDSPIWVRNVEQPSEAAAPIKMEVGIEDCLHIEFEYDRARYHLQDVVVGKIYFLLVRIKLKHMEVEIRRKETVGGGSTTHSELETLAKYEIMDGAPVRGESVPIRLYLSPYDLSPTYKDVHNKYSVRYFLNLVLVDEEDRRYFKQQEITLYRKCPPTPEEAAAAAAAPAPPPRLVQTPPMFNSDALLPPEKELSRRNSATSGVTIQKKSPPRPAPQPYHAAALAAAKSRQASRSNSLQNSRSNSLSGGGAVGEMLTEASDKAAAALAAAAAAGKANGGRRQSQGWMDGPLSPPPHNQSPTPEGRSRLPGVEPRHPTRFAPSPRLQSPQMSYMEPSLPVSSMPPPPSYEQQAAAPAAAPPPALIPQASPPGAQGASVNPKDSTTAALQSTVPAGDQQQLGGGPLAGAPNDQGLADKGSLAAAAPASSASLSLGAEGGAVGSPFAAGSPAEVGSPFAAASRAASIAAGGAGAASADPIFGEAQGDVSGDLEPLSFGNLEEEGKN